MREKILELLRDQFLISFKMGDNEEKLYQAIADKIMKIAEFEALCNPDLYEAHMNESVIDQNYVPREDYEHAVGHIGELQAEINYLRGQIETRDSNDKYRW